MAPVYKMLTGCAFMVAFAAIGVPSASAIFTLTSTKCTEGEGVATLCDTTTEKSTELFEVAGEEELTIKAESDGTFSIPSFLVLLSTTLKGENVILHQTSPLVTGYTLTGKLVFESVTVTEPPTCELPSSSITSEALLGIPNSKGTELTFEPELGSGAFVTFTIEGAECPSTLVGTYKIKGTQKCSIPSSAEDLKIHLLSCLKAGSNLKYFGSRATFEGTAEDQLSNDTTVFYSGKEA